MHQGDVTYAVTIDLDAKEQKFLQYLNVVLVTSLSASLAKGITIYNEHLKGHPKKVRVGKDT